MALLGYTQCMFPAVMMNMSKLSLTFGASALLLSGCAHFSGQSSAAHDRQELADYTRYCRPGSAIIYKMPGSWSAIPAPGRLYLGGSCLHQ